MPATRSSAPTPPAPCPLALRRINVAEENIAELAVLCGSDDDLAAQIAQVRNRLGGFLTQFHPALERVLGARLDHAAVITVLTRYPSPARLQTTERGHGRALLKKHAPRLGEKLTEEIFTALIEQTVSVTGTTAAGNIIGRLTEQLAQLGAQFEQIEAEILTVVDAHPLTQVLTSRPGVRARTAAWILTEVAGNDFKDAAHLTSYAASPPSPVTTGLPSAASRRHDAATKSSNGPCSPPRSPRSMPAPPPRPTRTANALRVNATTKPSSPWPNVAPVCSTRRCATGPSTPNPPHHQSPWSLDENHRSTRQKCPGTDVRYHAGDRCQGFDSDPAVGTARTPR